MQEYHPVLEPPLVDTGTATMTAVPLAPSPPAAPTDPPVTPTPAGPSGPPREPGSGLARATT